MIKKLKNLNPIILSLVSAGFALLSFAVLWSIDMEGEILKLILVIVFASLSFAIGNMIQKNTGMRIVLILSIVVSIISSIIALFHLVTGI